MAVKTARPEITQIESLRVLTWALDDKFALLLDEAEKRNGQRFDAQQDAVATALNAAEKAVNAAMTAAEKAVTKAETAAEKRFESVNEFRKTLSDQTATFLTRNEYAVQLDALSEKFDLASNRLVANERKLQGIAERGSGRNDTWIILTTVTAILISIASVVAQFGGHFVK